MSLGDPIGDMLTRIRNGQMRSLNKIEIPFSNCNLETPYGYVGFTSDFSTNVLFFVKPYTLQELAPINFFTPAVFVKYAK